MATSIAAWIGQNLRRADGGTRWSFEVDRSHSPVVWRWERYWEDELAEQSRGAYASFAECARDARVHGFHEGHPYSLRERETTPRVAWARPMQGEETRTDGSAPA